MGFSTIEQALSDLRAGKLIVCIDDPSRENEGDLICAAEFASAELVNRMAGLARGLICLPAAAGSGRAGFGCGPGRSGG